MTFKQPQASKKSKRGAYPPRLQWPGFKLDNPVQLLRFMQHAVEVIYCSKISSRQAGALNGAIRNLMDAYGMGDYRLEEMARRIEELEKATGIRGKTGGARTIQGIATAIQDS
jgi:hypothetical protein